ncbi:MAG: sulfatase-like hydrolase/transferase [bacterium]
MASVLKRFKNPDPFTALCGLAVLAGISLRFFRLGEPLWLDEVFTLDTAFLSAGKILKDLAYGSVGTTPPLFYLLLAGWMKGFPGTDVSLHFFTAVIGVLGIAAAWKVSTGLIGKRAGAAVAALLAIHPFHLAHSQELRPYGLLVLFTFLSFYFLQRALEQDRRRDWFLFSATGLACLYTHNYAIFLVAAEIGVGLAASFSLPERRLKILIAALIMAAGFAPWIPVVAIQTVKPMHSHLRSPTSQDIVFTLWSLLGFCVSAGVSASAPVRHGFILGMVYMIFVAFCVPKLVRQDNRLFLHMLIAGTAVLLAPIIISLKIPIYLAGRHSIIALPFVCIIIGWCVSSVIHEKLRIAVLAILLTMQGLTVLSYFRAPKSYYRDIADYLRVMNRPGYEILVSDRFMRISIQRYYPPVSRARESLKARPGGGLPPGIVTVENRDASAGRAGIPKALAHYRKIDEKIFGKSLVQIWAKRDGAQEAGRIACPGCNVILVSLDTLRADALGVYGYNRDTSPNLDRLALKGAVFLNAYSQAPHSLPSHMSVFTSQYPWTHKVEITLKDRLAQDITTLPMILKKHGYRTVWAAATNNDNLGLSAGFERGFDDFVPPARKPLGEWESAFSWLDKNRDRKFFMFLHTYHLHLPYTPEKSSILRFSRSIPLSKFITRKELYSLAFQKSVGTPLHNFIEAAIKAKPEISAITDPAAKWGKLRGFIKSDMHFLVAWDRLPNDMFLERFDLNSQKDMADLRTLYDAGVFEADMMVGSLYAGLKDLGLADNTLLVIMSDHGEEFMEHGQISHNQIFNELLHVPLIFVLPGTPRTAAGRSLPADAGRDQGGSPALASLGDCQYRRAEGALSARRRLGTKPAQSVQSIDIAPTILDAVGLPSMAGAEGSSLLSLIEGGESDAGSMTFARWNGDYSVRNERFTYIRRTCKERRKWYASRLVPCITEEFYDRAVDPGESKNIFSSNKAAAWKFSRRLDKMIESSGKGVENPWPAGIPEDVRERIRKTGYW